LRQQIVARQLSWTMCEATPAWRNAQFCHQACDVDVEHRKLATAGVDGNKSVTTSQIQVSIRVTQSSHLASPRAALTFKQLAPEEAWFLSM